MRRLASRRMRASCASAASPAALAPSKAPAAMADATSPARAPPMPSATAKKGGCSTSESSFALRCRPTSVRPTCSTMPRATPLLLVAVLAVANSDQIRHLEPFRGLDLTPIEIGPVGRAHVLEVHVLPSRKDARVGGRCEWVVYADRGAVRAAHRGALADVEGRARLVAHSGHDGQLGRDTSAQVGNGRLLAPAAGGLGR